MRCRCGCGEDAGTYSRTRAHKGQAAGQPRPFVNGHEGRRDPAERFWEKVARESECWIWTGALRNGYGHFGVGPGKQTAYAHRWVYEALVGPIPSDHELHHRCGDRRCVNPDHLEPVTRLDHMEKDGRLYRPRVKGSV